jgi:PAS domain S-box-containing protein
MTKTNRPTDAAHLRRRAEARLERRSGPPRPGPGPAPEAQRLVHELEVHQIELELQNDELRRARAELEAGLARFTDLYDFAPVGYLTLGRDGAIRTINLTGSRLLRLERARLVGRRLASFVAGTGLAAFDAFLEKVFADRVKQVCRTRIQTENGDALSLHIEAIRSGDGQECRAVLLDITGQQRLEDTVRFRMALLEFAPEHSLEELVRKTLDQLGALTGSPIGFYHVVEADQRTLSVQSWSTGTSRECRTAEGHRQHAPIDRAGVWAESARERRPVIHNDYPSLAHRQWMPEGHATLIRELVVPVLRRDRIVAMVGVGNKPSDYTSADVEVVSFLADVAYAMIERKSAEEALRHSEQLFRSLFESMTEGFALGEIIHDEAGRPFDVRLVDVNAAFARMAGLPVEFLMGRTAREHDPDIESHWIEALDRVARSGLPERLEHQVPSTGKCYEVLAWHSGPRRVAAVFNDVTERKRAESAILESEQRSREMAEELREADRNKDQFLALVSHELRNPLAPMRAGLHVLERAAPGTEAAKRALAVIDRQVVQMTRLIDDLLDVTRIARGKVHVHREPLDLRDVVVRAAEDHRGAFEANGAEFAVSVPDDPLQVQGDRTRLMQAVGNLLDNAVKFTPSGGRARLVLHRDAHAYEAVIRVQDTGAGISEDMLPRLFDAFVQADHTLDRSHGGLGLGLALVKGLVEVHGGSVSARSEGLGKGAEFTIRLPLGGATPASAS